MYIECIHGYIAGAIKLQRQAVGYIYIYLENFNGGNRIFQIYTIYRLNLTYYLKPTQVEQ